MSTPLASYSYHAFVSPHAALELDTVATPTDVPIKVDERQQTSIQGTYGAGDLANPDMASVTTVTWQCATAAIFAQRSMLA